MEIKDLTPWMTRGEAAEYLRVSKPTVDRWAGEGRLTRHRLAGSERTVRFRREELDALLEPELAEERSQRCEHSTWSEDPNSEELVCSACGASPAKAQRRGDYAELSPCGHTLDTAETWSTLRHHVGAYEVGGGLFWSCSTEMPGWHDEA